MSRRIDKKTKKEMADYAIVAWKFDRVEVFEFIPGALSVFLLVAHQPSSLYGNIESKQSFADAVVANVFKELSFVFEVPLEITLFDETEIFEVSYETGEATR